MMDAPKLLKRGRLVLWGLAGLGAVAAAVLLLPQKERVAPTVAEGDASAAYAMLGNGLADATLVSQTGERIRWAELNGRPRALFFGFTFCPEVCPTTLAELDAALRQLGPAGQTIDIVFVSIDPERDTPETLKAYFSGFGPRVRGYTGSAEEIARIADAFRASYSRSESGGGEYTMNHTAVVYLLNESGAVVDLIGYGSPPERTVAQMRALIRAD